MRPSSLMSPFQEGEFHTNPDEQKRATFQPSPANKPSLEMSPRLSAHSGIHHHTADSQDIANDSDSEFSFLTDLPPQQHNGSSNSISSHENLVSSGSSNSNYNGDRRSEVSSSSQLGHGYGGVAAAVSAATGGVTTPGEPIRATSSLSSLALSATSETITSPPVVEPYHQHMSNRQHAPPTSAYNTPAYPSPLHHDMSSTEFTANNTQQSLEKSGGIDDERVMSAEEFGSGPPRKPWYKRKLWIILLSLLALLIILAVVLIPVGLLVIKDDSGSDQSNSSSSSSDEGGNDSSKIPDNAKGTILDVSTWMDKTDFNTTYTSKTVGGLPIMGLNSTWDDSKRPNDRVPPLNQKFEYGKQPIHGVNLGGWLIIEPFITPSFFDEDKKIVDEWTYVESLNKSKGMDEVKKNLEKHYSTFVTEQTFKEIADAGLDHIRIPYGYWAIKTYSGDQFLPKVCWRYLLRAIEWARKYGLRVNIDLHSVPGGQNGWNHSGRQGYPQWLNGTKGGVYGNESLALHEQLGEFFSQDRYKNIVTIYGLVNEPKMQTLDQDLVTNWTEQAYKTVRKHGYNNTIVFGDGFLGAANWKGVFTPEEYPGMTLDLHNYVIFNTDTLKMTHTGKLNFVCKQWNDMMAGSTNNETGHGPTMVGEWSQADNDCNKYVNNVGVGSRWTGDFAPGYDTPSVLEPSCPIESNCTCDPSNQDMRNYSDAYKKWLLQFTELQMDIFESNGAWGSMYWTWDTEDWEHGQWSYKKGRQVGTIPKLAYERTHNCSAGIPDFNSMGLPDNY